MRVVVGWNVSAAVTPCTAQMRGRGLMVTSHSAAQWHGVRRSCHRCVLLRAFCRCFRAKCSKENHPSSYNENETSCIENGTSCSENGASFSENGKSFRDNGTSCSEKKNEPAITGPTGTKLYSPPVLRISLKWAPTPAEPGRCEQVRGWVPVGMGARIKGPRAG